MGNVILLLNQYGYIVLFVALTLELIAFPLPGELLMLYCGFLVFQGKLNLQISILMATLGAISGVTLSFFIGSKWGASLFYKYGHYVHLGPDKIEKVSKWFEIYGDKLLLITYFIPGVRHVTGYVSGIAKNTYKRFALFSYIGAFLWATTFIFLGKTLGPNWEKFHLVLKRYLIILCIIIATTMILVYFYKNHKQNIINNVLYVLNRGMIIFHSLGKIKVIVAMLGTAFLGFFVLSIGIIQDFLANEFQQYDKVIMILIHRSLDNRYNSLMNFFSIFSANKTLIVLGVLTFLLILNRGKNKALEIRFLISTTIGGELIETVLRTYLEE